MEYSKQTIFCIEYITDILQILDLVLVSIVFLTFHRTFSVFSRLPQVCRSTYVEYPGLCLQPTKVSMTLFPPDFPFKGPENISSVCRVNLSHCSGKLVASQHIDGGVIPDNSILCISRNSERFWAILPLPLIQEEQLSVTGERMCTKYC